MPTDRRYTCNGVLGTEATPLDNLRTLLGAMAGAAVWVQGRWLIRAGSYITPTTTITESDLASGPVSIAARASRRTQCNRVSGTFFDPEQLGAEVTFPPVVNASYKVADGGQELTREIQLPMTDSSVHAQRLAKVTLERSRQAATVTIRCNHHAYNLAPTDTVNLSLTRYGYTPKAFEVRSRKYDGDVIEYGLQEITPSMFHWNGGEETVYDPAEATSLPNPFATPGLLGNLTVTSGVSQARFLPDGTIIPRALVQWTQSVDAFVRQGGRIEVEYKLDTAIEWQRMAPVSGDATSAFIEPLATMRITLVRVRAINAAAKVGPWATIAHTATPITDVNRQTPVSLLTKGTGMVINGATVVKAGGTLDWNAGVYSKNALTGGCIVSCVAPDATYTWMIGLSNDPSASSSYTTIDYAIFHPAGTLEIYELGVPKLTGLTFNAGDTLEVEYNGACVEYRRNGESLRIVAAPLNLTLSLDSSFWSVGGEARALRFAPVTPVPAQYSVGSYGFAAVSPPVAAYLVNEATSAVVDLGGIRSYCLTRISLATGLVTFTQGYDVFTAGTDPTAGAGYPRGAAELAADLNASTAAEVVVVKSFDEPQQLRLSAGLEAAMYRCGASRQVFGSPNFKARAAYILVGIPGSGHGNGFEAYAGAIDNDPNAWCQMAFQISQEGKLIGGTTAVWDPTGATTTTHLTDEAATSVYTATHVATQTFSSSA